MRIDVPEEKFFVHESIMPIRWGDMDALGHINNTVYFRYMEQARINWLDSCGFNFAQGDFGVVVVNAFCNFLKTVEYPGDLLIRTYIANPGRASVDTFNLMSLTHTPDALVAAAGATMVWANLKAQKAVSWPDEIKTLFQQVSQ